MQKTYNLIASKLRRLAKKAFRQEYVRANIEHGIAHQIRLLRTAKKWSQRDLAVRLGAKGQSTIARLEDPSYGRYSLATLIKLSNVFDVALTVKFVSFGKLLAETNDLSPEALRAQSFREEFPKLSPKGGEALGYISRVIIPPSTVSTDTIVVEPTPPNLTPFVQQSFGEQSSYKGANEWVQ